MRISDWSSDVCSSDLLALLRVVQLRQCLVPARVDIAPFQPQAHARAALGAVAQARGVDVALGRRERDLHRHPAFTRSLRMRLDVDAAEVVKRPQRLAPTFQAPLVVVLAFFPVAQVAKLPLANVTYGSPHQRNPS